MSAHAITIAPGGIFTLDCAGVTDECALWEPCRHPDCPPFDWANYDGEHLHHGVEHSIYMQRWEAPTGDCSLLVTSTAAAHIARTLAATRGPGTYPLMLTWEGDTLALRVSGSSGIGGLWIAGGTGTSPRPAQKAS